MQDYCTRENLIVKQTKNTQLFIISLILAFYREMSPLGSSSGAQCVRWRDVFPFEIKMELGWTSWSILAQEIFPFASQWSDVSSHSELHIATLLFTHSVFVKSSLSARLQLKYLLGEVCTSESLVDSPSACLISFVRGSYAVR